MGGKVWSEEEERVFWTEIIPTSSKRLLHDRPHAQDAKGWEDLCQVMQQTMGNQARRQYTALMLYEHFFQNTVLKRYSPNAAKYARAYQDKDAAAPDPSPDQRSRAVQRHRQDLGSDEPPEGPEAAGRSNDPLQLALDAFEILARVDGRSHQGGGHAGFLDTACQPAYAYGSACNDVVCRCTDAGLGAGAGTAAHAAGFAAFAPRAAQSLLPRALLCTQGARATSAADPATARPPSAGLLAMTGDSNSDGTPGPGQNAYYGYAASSLRSPPNQHGHGRGHGSQQDSGEIMWQDLGGTRML